MKAAILSGLGLLVMAGAAPGAQILQTLNYSAGVNEDANISPWNSYNNHNGNWIVGSNGNTEQILKFALPALPGGSVIDSAVIRLYGYGFNNLSSLSVTAYALLQNWSYANVNWQNYDTGMPWNAVGARGSGTDHDSTVAGTVLFSTQNAYSNLDITTQYQQWYSGAENNYGIIMMPDAVGTVSDYIRVGDLHGTAQPVLEVNYHVVPEPASLGLLATAGLLAMRRRR